jgi:demethylmenaquinone methyltransferase/2-methoxy-6-polyprenyl-1,4-benzoquinol methylase
MVLYMTVDNVTRVLRSREEAKASYDRMSPWYDWISGGAERKCRNLGLQMLEAEEDERILEIGFGTGLSIMELARAVGSSGMVFGIDISEGMLQVVKPGWRRLVSQRW